MSAPQRRRPGASSPISLTPNVEPVNTGTPVSAEDGGVAQGSAPRRTTSPAESATQRPSELQPAVEEDGTVATTTLLRRSLKRQAQTAVLRVQQEPGGYRSFAQLVNGAIERELQRLAHEYNGGVPFEQNPGPFRTGRPFSG
jgi:hypothetical protein